MASLVGANRAQGGEIARFTIPAPPGVNICAYPSLARLINDRLLCVYSASDPRRDGKIMLVGVFSSDDANTRSAPEVRIDKEPHIILSNGCLVYDSTEDNFEFVEPLRLAVADHGLASFNSDLLAVGGEDSIYRTRTDLVQQASNVLVSWATNERIAGPQSSYDYSSASNRNSAIAAYNRYE